ncbi:MAG: DUF1761 domain-containing protein [Patescibacteria group bacterium]
MPVATLSAMGIVLAVVASMVIGAAWFGMFADQWTKALGKKKSEMKGAPMTYALQTVYALVTAYVLSHFVDYATADTLMEGAQTGFWIWLGFVATFTAGNTLWEGKHWDLWMINNGNYLLTLMAMGAILAVY